MTEHYSKALGPTGTFLFFFFFFSLFIVFFCFLFFSFLFFSFLFFSFLFFSFLFFSFLFFSFSNILLLVEEIDISGAEVFQKTKFSMLTPEVDAYLRKKERTNVVLYGIEV